MTVRCSIIVPTFNRADRLRRLLDALERQDIGAAAFQVVVCDDGSTDGTQAVLAAPRPYRLTTRQRENGGPGPARNDAIVAATGDLLIFFDDDVEPSPDAIRLHAEAHEHDRDLVVLGTMHPHDAVRTPWIAWELKTLARQYDNMTRGVYEPTPRQFFTANASVRREHVVNAGMFDPAYRRAEDVELAFRLEALGLRFAFRPGIRVWHDPDRSLAAWKRVAHQYGEYDVRMWRAGRYEDALRCLAHEYGERHVAVRAAARAFAGRGATLSVASAAIMAASRAAYAIRFERAALAAASIVFNIEYLDGCAKALGGRRKLWDIIADPDAAAPARAVGGLAGERGAS